MVNFVVVNNSQTPKFVVKDGFENCDGKMCGMGKHIGGGHYVCHHNNLKKKYPELVKEWNYELNSGNPEDYFPYSHYRAHWICKNNFDHKWETKIYNRTRGTGCRICLITSNPDKSLKALFPTLCEEWDYSLNEKGPEHYFPRSHYLAHWICKNNNSHKWETEIYNRTNGKGCRHCSHSKGYSKSQIEWLQQIERMQNITIQNALSPEGEYRINGIGKVDGYCQSTNTIYEFHGDYFHGNPNIYDRNDVNERSNERFGALYDRTVKRDNKIRSLNYNLIVQWETPFDDYDLIMQIFSLLDFN